MISETVGSKERAMAGNSRTMTSAIIKNPDSPDDLTSNYLRSTSLSAMVKDRSTSFTAFDIGPGGDSVAETNDCLLGEVTSWASDTEDGEATFLDDFFLGIFMERGTEYAWEPSLSCKTQTRLAMMDHKFMKLEKISCMQNFFRADFVSRVS